MHEAAAAWWYLAFRAEGLMHSTSCQPGHCTQLKGVRAQQVCNRMRGNGAVTAPLWGPGTSPANKPAIHSLAHSATAKCTSSPEMKIQPLTWEHALLPSKHVPEG